MNRKVYLSHTGTPHEGDIPHSGRYPWGSGENPNQHGFNFLVEVQRLRDKGMTNTEIAKAMGYSTGEWRAKLTNAKAEKYASDAAKVAHMRYDRQMSNVAIAKELGLSEGTVRNMLKNPEKMKDQILDNTVDILRTSVKNKTYIDVGEGVERDLGIPRTKMDAALQKLKDEGYVVKPIQVPQINSTTGQKTTVLVLAPEGTTGRELYLNMDKIKLINEYHSDDLGLTYGNIKRPVPVDSKRIEINYADKDGFQPKDGVIELRPGVEDISLGNSKYAQVRINVDDKYYLKGMAIYSNDLPDGIDIRFNTNKAPGTPASKVFKELKPVNPEDPNSPIDWDNPFGATIKAGGQREYIGKDGEKHLSAINKVNEEGDWGEWDKTLASQFLSKQNLELARKQLNITYLNKKDEFDEIKSISNPTVREKLLYSFADDCDASAVELKAASMPRQATQVLLPLNSIKENEIYAPNFKDGEHVCLVRYPHSGPSEIPDLIVNNRNKEAIAIFGKTPKDCVVINPKIAPKLSGADFDGDSVVVIPNKNGKTIKTAPSLKDPANPLKTLQDWDPKIAYPEYPGMKIMKENRKGTEMGMIANLITDMTLQGCSEDELARAIKHSMVVIDAPKHHLNWKQSEKDNNIKELREKYQGSSKGGASTIISRAKSQEYVPERKLYVKINKETGEKEYTYTDATYTQTKTLKNGEVRTKEIARKTKSTKMYEANDAFDLTSNPKDPLPMEKIYAPFANQMKDLANQARLEITKTKSDTVSKQARETYAPEVESLERKLNKSLSNAPYERQAQMTANMVVKAKKEANPSMTDAEKRKKGQQALNAARANLIPGGKRQRIEITEKEWEAINANAINSTKLKLILNNTDLDIVRSYATPKQSKGLSDAKISRAKAMLATGYYTQADVAELFGISPTTLMRYVNS